jgi:hypothetical protein
VNMYQTAPLPCIIGNRVVEETSNKFVNVAEVSYSAEDHIEAMTSCINRFKTRAARLKSPSLELNSQSWWKYLGV